ncbi:Uncharacterized protein FWK35_00021208 [Aphis craccivora]|uniref:Uncharacterized protein n=1 Tax=Aphis craccivora TaxID=307492 RepID=A0A6G0ZEU5_APHCR|nr:Uncharacterized protein FWK35_00021208 [Aphis craccivora]
MPPTSKIDFHQIHKVLTERKSDTFDKETKLLKSPNDAGWKDIINQLNFNISPKYLYLIVKENRHDNLTKLKLILDVYMQNNQQDISESESSKEPFGDYDDFSESK